MDLIKYFANKGALDMEEVKIKELKEAAIMVWGFTILAFIISIIGFIYYESLPESLVLAGPVTLGISIILLNVALLVTSEVYNST